MLKNIRIIIKLILLVGINYASFTHCLANTIEPNQTLSEHGIYLKGGVGAFLPATQFNKDFQKKDRPSLLASLGIGYRASENIRGDLSFIHKGNYSFFKKKEKQVRYTSETQERSMEEGEWSITTNLAMINGYYDIPTQTMLTPYITGGIGIALHEVKDSNFIEGLKGYKCAGTTQKSFAWSAGVGTLYKIHNKVFIDFNYKYTDMGKVIPSYYDFYRGRIGSNVWDKGSLRSHDISLGVIVSL